jgi:arylsulfatase A-like enzyme
MGVEIFLSQPLPFQKNINRRSKFRHNINKMAKSKQKQPNILVIWGDDIGITNLSCYSHGLMGYQTPNIDRIAKEGMIFTDAYGEQSCTAGRSSFITGQSVYRAVQSRHAWRTGWDE